MPFIDGVGTLQSPASVFTAAAVVDTVDAVPVTPLHKATVGHTDLLVFVSNSGGNSDVQIEVSTVTSFASLAYSTTLTNVADGHHGVTATGLVSGTTYYWRARAADTGTSGWSDWSSTSSVTPPVAEPFQFRFLSGMSAAHDYLYLNAGAHDTPDPRALDYLYVNVGVEQTPDPRALDYLYLNVGFEQPIDPDAHDYIYLGDISTNTPTPHLWFIRPDSGRPLDGVDVVGHGVGDLQATYDGEVQIKAVGEDDWVSISVVSWQTYPATANAYTEDRLLDPIIPTIDMEHTVIGVVIPADAIPPGYQVRIRTDGP